MSLHELTDEQRAIRELARQFASDRVAPYAAGWDRDHTFPRDLYTKLTNAGIMLFGRDTIATELDLATWQQCIDVNLTGMFLTCKHGIRALLRNGGGSRNEHGARGGARGV